MKSLIVPRTTDSIEDAAFRDCGLESIEILNSEVILGEDVFSCCYSLKRIIIGTVDMTNTIKPPITNPDCEDDVDEYDDYEEIY